MIDTMKAIRLSDICVHDEYFTRMLDDNPRLFQRHHLIQRCARVAVRAGDPQMFAKMLTSRCRELRRMTALELERIIRISMYPQCLILAGHLVDCPEFMSAACAVLTSGLDKDVRLVEYTSKLLVLILESRAFEDKLMAAGVHVAATSALAASAKWPAADPVVEILLAFKSVVGKAAVAGIPDILSALVAILVSQFKDAAEAERTHEMSRARGSVHLNMPMSPYGRVVQLLRRVAYYAPMDVIEQQVEPLEASWHTDLARELSLTARGVSKSFLYDMWSDERMSIIGWY